MTKKSEYIGTERLDSCRSWLPGSSYLLTAQRADIPDRVAFPRFQGPGTATLPVYPSKQLVTSCKGPSFSANRESHWAEPRALPILGSRRSQRPPDDLSITAGVQITAGEISNRKLGRTEEISGTAKRTEFGNKEGV